MAEIQSVLFIQYPKCSTCQKAEKWLKNNNISFNKRSIVEDNPTIEELTVWLKVSNLPVAKFFNTSGKIYKEQNLKDFVKVASDDELIALLASNGMLVKRPLIVCADFVLVGFNESLWSEHML